MATADASPIFHELTIEFDALKHDPHIEAIYSEWVDESYVVWVGIREDSAIARKMVYFLEDQMSEKFPDILFDFHVISLPEGKKTQDYVSRAELIFRNTA